MKQHRELRLRFEQPRSEEFFRAVDAALPEGWRRDHGAERDVPTAGAAGREFYYYTCERRDGREPALVAVYRRDALNFYVSNVVPRESNQLSVSQYNQVLQDFHDEVLSRVQTDVPVVFWLDTDQLRLEDLLPADVMARLRAFSAAANRSTGSSHPLDRERWFEFIVGLHRDGAAEKLSVHDLERWLVEVEKWPPQAVSKLAVEFEFAVALLEHVGR